MSFKVAYYLFSLILFSFNDQLMSLLELLILCLSLFGHHLVLIHD